MTRTVLRFGLASGAVLAAMTAVMLPLCMNGVIDFEFNEVIGYSAMILAFLLVFFGIRSYREGAGGGAIGFGKAFQVGILITLVTCAVYVIGWEIVYFNFAPDFADRYSAYVLDGMREDGATEAAIAAMEVKMAEFKRLYANPLFNVAITFMEVFPVGLIVTLVSAAILRKRPAPPAAATARA